MDSRCLRCSQHFHGEFQLPLSIVVTPTYCSIIYTVVLIYRSHLEDFFLRIVGLVSDAVAWYRPRIREQENKRFSIRKQIILIVYNQKFMLFEVL